MGKKCIPGVFCIENMTLFTLMIVVLFVGYAFYKLQRISSPPVNINIMGGGVGGGGNTKSAEIDDGIPPQNVLGGVALPPLFPFYGSGAGELSGIPTARVTSLPASMVPVNIETRPSSGYQYVQVGMISTRDDGKSVILPLMGRRLTRNKWQYYTLSNSHLHIKLPISVNGRNAGGEYGIDPISSGDSVYVEGYDEVFTANIYENTRLDYLPVF